MWARGVQEVSDGRKIEEERRRKRDVQCCQAILTFLIHKGERKEDKTISREMEEEKTEREGGRVHFHLKLNYAWQGSWSEREEERWMERERGEERTHLRRGMDRGQVERRGSRKGKGWRYR